MLELKITVNPWYLLPERSVELIANIVNALPIFIQDYYNLNLT